MVKEWNELQLDEELEFVTAPIEKVQLVKYSGAAGDYHMIHHDDELAKEVGLPGIIAHGMISMGILGEFVSQIVGNHGFVSDLQVRFIGMVFPSQSLTCRAKVVGKCDSEKKVDFEVSAEVTSDNVATVGNVSAIYFS